MKRIFTFITAATLAVSLMLPASAQTPIEAPAGWTTQTRAGGAQTFTPPDLRAGEKYSVTVYDSVSLGDKTLEEYLRKFAGPVGKTVGKLGAPLQIKTEEGIVIGSGVYIGPNGTYLFAVFSGVSIDGGANIHMMRTLMSQVELLKRYQTQNGALIKQLAQRAKAEAGSNASVVPDVVSQQLKVIGGPIQPGMYAGNQLRDQELRQRFRVYLYPTGEYRLCDDKDEDLNDYGSTGNIGYNRNSGQLDIKWTQGLGFHSDGDFCYYGRDAQGKPAIYAESYGGAWTKRVLLTYVGPPIKRVSASQEEAVKAELQAERLRYKWTTAPGKGVQNAQIAAIIRHFDVDLEPGMTGLTSHTTDEAFLLLRNGTVYAGLPVPPGEFDTVRSRQHEPAKWGKWRQVGGRYQVSWEGAPFQALPGHKVLPAPAGLHLNGYYRAVSSSSDALGSSLSIWGVTFGPDGRFRKSTGGSSIIGSPNSPAGAITTTHDENGTFVGGKDFSLSSKSNNPNGNSEGTYALNGYTLTLRYDNGRVARWPFFFVDRSHEELWFENGSLGRHDEK